MVERTRVIEEAEARQLPVLIDEWWNAPDHRRWIARALRIDLALLTERPELVVPCLHRWCAWPGAAGEAAFYNERPEVPAEAAALRDAMQGWRPGVPWLRSLRPPPIPLDAGVLEEYRTSIPGELAFSADGEAVGVAGEEGAIAWDRRTGRRLASPVRALGVAPRARRWQRDHASTWGTLIFASEERRVAIDISDDEIARDFWELGPDLVLVDLDDIEMEHRAALVDLSRGRIVGNSAGRCRAVAMMPGGGAIAIGTDDGIDVLDLETGQARSSWTAPNVSAVAVAPDGLIASRSGNVIRVWEPAVAAARTCGRVWTRFWTEAEFSADGARLVTGAALCDARTGALLARLDVNTPGWLMGGPPDRCQRLTTTAFAQIIPFGLTLWDARDGTPLEQDDQRRAGHSDVVAFDAIGRHHAIASEDGRLSVHRLRGGEQVFTLAVPRVEALGFSSDGTRVWWQNEQGERWVVELPGPDEDGPLPVRRLSEGEPVPAEPAPREVAVADGLLVAGGMAIPCDDPAAVTSLDGRYFASRTSHYALEDD